MSYVPTTGWEGLSAVGRDKMLSQLPRGTAPAKVQFALSIAKVSWIDGQYHIDAKIRTVDLQLVIGRKLWKLWPSMLPQEVMDALDTDAYDNVWFLLETIKNKNARTEGKTKFMLLDIQQRTLDQTPQPPTETGPPSAASGQSQPLLGDAVYTSADSGGQPGAGDAPVIESRDGSVSPAAPLCPKCGQPATVFDGQWVHCGERIG